MENVFGGVTLDVTGPGRWRKEAIGFHSENGKKLGNHSHSGGPDPDLSLGHENAGREMYVFTVKTEGLNNCN